jgi:hypothetical protein
MNWQFERTDELKRLWHLFAHSGSACDKFDIAISVQEMLPPPDADICHECLRFMTDEMNKPVPANVHSVESLPDLPVLMEGVNSIGGTYYRVHEKGDVEAYLESPVIASYRLLGPPLDPEQRSELTRRLTDGTAAHQTQEDRKVFDALVAKHGFTTEDDS